MTKRVGRERSSKVEKIIKIIGQKQTHQRERCRKPIVIIISQSCETKFFDIPQGLIKKGYSVFVIFHNNKNRIKDKIKEQEQGYNGNIVLFLYSKDGRIKEIKFSQLKKELK